MSSLIPGYEYDIFVSYRHKDNKYDGWVTAFVDDLRKELDATFKEEAIIYFDQNPQDGLHENHDVDDSLKDKIRCLIFIPIISRTYCDPKSFAWNKEFLGFRDFATQDKLGLKVKLASANVSSRILPVRIHDLDTEDIQLYEKETGSVLRPIDFIFKSSGVNRPLAHHDERKDNVNHTYYRDQINKVAIAIKEIVTALKHTTVQSEVVETKSTPLIQRTKGLSVQKMVMAVVIVILLAIIGYGATMFLGKGTISSNAAGVETMDRSIAVLPFANMSTDKDQEYFSDGLSEELLNLLTRIPSLKVISRTSAFSFKGKNEDIRLIGQKLGVAYLLEGSVRKANDKVRITAQLIKASDGSHLWSQTFDRDMNDIFKVQDEIANAVVSELKGQLMGTNAAQAKDSKPSVYNLWLESRFYLNKGTPDGITKAMLLAEQAFAIDSTDARVLSQLSRAYETTWAISSDRREVEPYKEKSRIAAEKAIQLDPNLADGYYSMSWTFYDVWDMSGAANYCQKALDLEPTNVEYMNLLGRSLRNLGKLNNANELFIKSVEFDPLNPTGYYNIGLIQQFTGDYTNALKNLRKSLELVPTPSRFLVLSFNYMLMGDHEQARQHGQKIDDNFWKEYVEIITLWAGGKKDESRKLLKKFEVESKEGGPFQIAEIYAWYGEKEKAFEWLDLAFKYNDPGLTEIKVSVFFKPYQDDPRYADALKKLKFPL